MKKRTFEFIYLGLVSAFYFLSLIMLVICEFAYSAEWGIYFFSDEGGIYSRILDILFLLFSISGLVLWILAFLKKRHGLKVLALHLILAGFGLGIAVSIIAHTHYNFGTNDHYFISISALVFDSINLLLTIALMIVYLLNKAYHTKKDVITAAIHESNADDNIEKIRKYKKLLDEGIITQEEFEKKKKELL